MERYLPGSSLFTNAAIWDREIGTKYIPKNADDFKRVLLELNHPADGRWAMGSYQGVAFNIEGYTPMFGSPNNWQLDSSGKLTKDFETPQYREAVAYLRDLIASGVFHPDSNVIVNNVASQAPWMAGKFVLRVGGFGVSWGSFWEQGLALTPPQDFWFLPPFPAASPCIIWDLASWSPTG